MKEAEWAKDTNWEPACGVNNSAIPVGKAATLWNLLLLTGVVMLVDPPPSKWSLIYHAILQHCIEGRAHAGATGTLWTSASFMPYRKDATEQKETINYFGSCCASSGTCRTPPPAAPGDKQRREVNLLAQQQPERPAIVTVRPRRR